MLPNACRWIHSDEGSYLQWNAGCIGYVKQRDDQWTVQLQGWGILQTHPCASRGQGVRYLERWASSRKGFPGMGNVKDARARMQRESKSSRDGLARLFRDNARAGSIHAWSGQ